LTSLLSPYFIHFFMRLPWGYYLFKPLEAEAIATLLTAISI
jgi:hypothetical protein